MKDLDHWYYLDPDYRRNPPKNTDGTDQPHCCRCQKPFKAKGTFISVTVNYDTMQVEKNPFGKELIGLDCWKQITTSKKHSKENFKTTINEKSIRSHHD